MKHTISRLTHNQLGGVALAQALIAIPISVMIFIGTTATGSSATSPVKTLSSPTGIASPEA